MNWVEKPIIKKWKAMFKTIDLFGKPINLTYKGQT